VTDIDAAVVGELGAPPRANPYVGLLPFTEHDVAWFFGREREQRIIGANMRSSRLTLLYGASGVGKSSVLLAAVVPELRAIVAEDRAARGRQDPGEREPVRFAVAVLSDWRDAPVRGLATAVAASVEEATGEPVEPWSAGTPLREAFAGWLGPVAHLLVVLDQFEEYFLYHPHDDGPGTFAGEFVDVVNDAGLRVNFLVSLREDGLAKLDRFKGRVPHLFDNYLRVGHLDLEAARQAIERPKDEYNRRLPAGADQAWIDPALVDKVLTEVRTREIVLDGRQPPEPEAPAVTTTATARVETPLLQLVMQRLWYAAATDGRAPRLELTTLTDKLGGAERIVYRHLEEAIGALTHSDRAIAADVLGFLVSPSGTKIAWRTTDLAFWAKRDTAEIEPVLQELSHGEQRILRSITPPPGQADPSPRYEIFHDILAEAVLEWCDEHEAQREREAIARELEHQERERREAEERRRRERLNKAVRAVALGLAALTIGLIVAVFVAVRNRDVAHSRELAASAMAQLPIDPERSVKLAMEAVDERRTDESEQALRRSLAASYVRATLLGSRSRPCAACGALARAPRGGGGAVTQTSAVAADGRTVAGIVGGRLRLWRPSSGETSFPDVDVGTALGVAFTPDAERLLVLGSRRGALMAPDGGHAVPLRGKHMGGATSPDGRYVATVGSGGAAVWDAASGRPRGRLGGTGYVSVAFQGPGAVVLQNDDGRLLRWRWTADGSRQAGRLRLPTRVQPIAAAAGPRFSTRFSDGARFAVDGAAGGKVRVVDARGRELRLPPGTPSDPVDDAAISPDGSRVVTVRDETAQLWRLERPWRRPARSVAGLDHTEGINTVTFSADSRLVGTTSTDGTARIWESSTGGLVTELRGHAAGVESLAFAAGGRSTSTRFVVTVGEDLTMRLWDLGVERALRGPKSVDVVAPASDSSVALVEEDGALKVWDTRSRSARTLGLRIEGMRPTTAAVARDGRSVLVGYATPDQGQGAAALQDMATGSVLARLSEAGPVYALALDPAGRLAAVVRREEQSDLYAELWALRRGGEAQRRWRVPISAKERVTDVAFSPDGRRLLVTTVHGAARVYDIRSRKQVHALATGTTDRPGSEAFYRGVFSPDGETIAVAGSRNVRLWDSSSGEELGFSLAGHTSVLRSIAYSRDGDRIVTAGADGTTRVWDARDGTALAVLDRHAGRVNTAAFLPDGTIVSGGEDRTVRVYACETCAGLDTLLRRARSRVTRDFDEGP